MTEQLPLSTPGTVGSIRLAVLSCIEEADRVVDLAEDWPNLAARRSRPARPEMARPAAGGPPRGRAKDPGWR
jgi:hypothetical protein